MQKLRAFFVIAILICSLSMNGQQTSKHLSEMKYPYQFKYEGNPLSRIHGAADPNAVVWDGVVWLYCSQDRFMKPGVHDSHYDAMDGYHVFSSSDLVNWTDHGEIFHSSYVSWAKDGWLWAPGAARKDGKYYLYYPIQSKQNEWRIGVAIADSPAGPFKDMGKPIDGITGIDPCVFIDDDGEAYIFNNNHIVAKLKPNMTELAEPVRNINYAPKEITENDTLQFCEGSYMHKRNGIYYYSYSNFKNETNQAFYAMGNSPYGPFEWKGAMAPNPDGAQDHHSVIEFKGEWYYFYHIANNEFPKYKEEQGRIACFERLYYNSDGTIVPVVHTYGSTKLLKVASDKGSVTFNPPGRSYTPGTTVQMTAKGYLGFAFKSWSGDISVTANPGTIVMDKDKSVTANYVTTPTYKLSINTKNGKVKMDPEGGVYNKGTVVTLSSIDDFGYDFGSWKGDLSGTQKTTTITMDADKNVVAEFVSIPTYKLNVSGANGLVLLDPAGGTYETGTKVTLTAKKDFGYQFSKWSGDFAGTQNPVTIEMNADKNILANFDSVGGGTIVFAVNCGGDAYKSDEGVQYSADKLFNGGNTYKANPEIDGTNDDVLYKSERVGQQYGYKIPLSNGRYEVTLKFAEIFFGSAGNRVCNVLIEGKEVLSNFDIWAKVGKNKAFDQTFPIDLTDGELNIDIKSIKESGKISAIKIVKP